MFTFRTKINGHAFSFHTDIPGHLREEYFGFVMPGGQLWLSKYYGSAIFEATLRRFDAALPQSFFDEYVEINGERPIGVWCYDEERGCSKIFGDYVSRTQVLDWFGQMVKQKYQEEYSNAG